MAVQKHLSSFVLSNRQYQEHQEGRALAEKQLGLELCYCGIVGQALLDQCVQQQQHGEDNAGSLVASCYHDDDDFDDEDNDDDDDGDNDDDDNDDDDDAEHGDQQQRAGSLVTSSSRGSFCCTQLENSHNGARLACCLDKGSQNIWFLMIQKDICAFLCGPCGCPRWA